VTRWSKLGTTWRGVPVEALLTAAGVDGDFVVATSYGGYTTNLPLADLLDGKAWVAYEYDGRPLTAEHGGPARLLVPHLYFWKSAKWLRSLRLQNHDEPGFWEQLGYHIYGDPWQEQRHWGD
jgi:DMSO/TMAO reductase YedYZ molybdopterin-dependent catalytic subunit